MTEAEREAAWFAAAAGANPEPAPRVTEQQMWEACADSEGADAESQAEAPPADPIESLLAECADKTPAEIASVVRHLEAREGVPLSDDRKRFLPLFRQKVAEIESPDERSTEINNA